MTLKNVSVLKVRQFAPNHTEVVTTDSVILQSYNSIVAVKHDHAGRNGAEVTLGRDWDYSRTTMKYLGQWLGHNTAETRKRLDNGRYEYDSELA